MQASVNRYLRECAYTHSFLKLREFASWKAFSEGKVRVIRKDGKGRRPNKSSGFVLSS